METVLAGVVGREALGRESVEVEGDIAVVVVEGFVVENSRLFAVVGLGQLVEGNCHGDGQEVVETDDQIDLAN